jgi:hypothetical protein
MCRIALAVLAAAGCHSFYQVHGTVHRCVDRQPIDDAVVVLRYPGELGVRESEPDGSFSVAVNDPPGNAEGQLLVAAPGHRLAVRTVHHGEAVDVCLDPE